MSDVYRQAKWRANKKSRLPKCETCKEHKVFINERGTGTVRICMRSKRAIRIVTDSCPFWCKRRDE